MNPKALNLEVLNELDTNVTLGFKCDPALKLHLANQASQFGYSLSSYVHNLVSENQKFLDVLIDNYLKEIDILTKKVNFFDNNILKNILEKQKGKVVTYKTYEGVDEVKKVTTTEDVYSIIINSFKAE